MGWASGTELFEKIIDVAKEKIPDNDTRQAFYKEVILAFEDQDWDCQTECCGKDYAFDLALKELYPKWFEEE